MQNNNQLPATDTHYSYPETGTEIGKSAASSKKDLLRAAALKKWNKHLKMILNTPTPGEQGENEV